MAKKAKTDLVAKPAGSPTPVTILQVDARIGLGMFFTLSGTVLTAFGLSTRDHVDVYAKSLGIDANLWWGLPLLVFGILMLTLGRHGQARMAQADSEKK